MSNVEITASPTELVRRLTDTPVRLWRGKTAGGIEVNMFVSYVTVRNPEDFDRLAAEMGGLSPSMLDKQSNSVTPADTPTPSSTTPQE